MTTADWIAVDWGTTSLRVWAMRASGEILNQWSNQQGMGKLSAIEYEQHLLALIQDYLPASGSIPVLVCGMAGAREGWQEAPYLAVPLSLPQQLTPVPVVTQDPRVQVLILPGLKQMQPANVMRGEETQMAGFLQQQPQFSGVLALPGTHTKWVQLNQQQVTGFASIMTGEVFDLLSQQSILRHTLSGEQWRQDVFEAHFQVVIKHPVGFAGRLFGLRAESLLHGQAGTVGYAKLSAELIGLELAAVQELLAVQPQDKVVVIGNDHLSELYRRALTLMGYQAESLSGTGLSLAGLSAAYQNLCG